MNSSFRPTESSASVKEIIRWSEPTLAVSSDHEEERWTTKKVHFSSICQGNYLRVFGLLDL
jgi:hypothetical protein